MTTGTNQFVPFATGTGANVYSPSAYAGLPARATGVVNGVADGPTFNSAWRQGSSMAAMLGQFISAHGLDARDDGDISTLKTNFEAALSKVITAALPSLAGYVQKIGDTMTGRLSAPGFRAAKGYPGVGNNAASVGFSFGIDGDTGIFADGTGADDTTIVEVRINGYGKVRIAADGRLACNADPIESVDVVRLGYLNTRLAALGGGGGGLPANAAGWLHNDGSGVLAWTTPSTAYAYGGLGTTIVKSSQGVIPPALDSTTTFTVGGVSGTYKLAYKQAIYWFGDANSTGNHLLVYVRVL